MNKYDMTLRKLRHEKLLFQYYDDHMTKEMSQCIQLYDNKRLGDYTASDLLIMLKNEIEPEFLIELALEYIEDNLFYKAYSYEGDLLTALSIQNKAYWDQNPEQKERLVQKVKVYEERINLAKYHLGL